MNTLTETEKAYLAGFIDGEGCISIVKQTKKESRNPYYRLSLIVSQTNYEFLQHWQQLVGIGKMNEKMYQTMASEHCARAWDWRVSTGDAAELLESLLPYLRIKKTEAEIAIKFQRGFQRSSGIGWQVPAEVIAEREAIYQQMHELKVNYTHKRGRKRQRLDLYNDAQ
jgi:hypothetical protein